MTSNEPHSDLPEQPLIPEAQSFGYLFRATEARIVMQRLPQETKERKRDRIVSV